jgi:hypothetical protein
MLQPLTLPLRTVRQFIEPAILTGNLTLNVAVPADIEQGTELLVVLKATGTEVTTFGTGIEAPTITGVAGKTKTQKFEYVGSQFIATSAVIQID